MAGLSVAATRTHLMKMLPSQLLPGRSTPHLELHRTTQGAPPSLQSAVPPPVFVDVMIDDPQRKLTLHKPRLPSGEFPPGFLGIAVNTIHLDREYLSCLTANGHGLRETLFYSLFSHLQVSKTRADLRCAIPLINDGAISLDGGILRPNSSFCLGERKNIEVKFTVTVSHGPWGFKLTWNYH